jgi:uracil-DNA glycosylase family 4
MIPTVPQTQRLGRPLELFRLRPTGWDTVPRHERKSPVTQSLDPSPSCALCPRLVGFRSQMQAENPDWHNAPVPAFGGTDVQFLVVGLAPGMKGANRTGRPFTGDVAGRLLFSTLIKFDFAKGAYNEDPHDGLELIDTRITNAVRCLPPDNKPTGGEVTTCRDFLKAEIFGLKRLRVILALGGVAHKAVVGALGHRQASVPFAHGAVHQIEGFALTDSYHCSQYNVNTGRLTPEMFHGVFAGLRVRLSGPFS